MVSPITVDPFARGSHLGEGISRIFEVGVARIVWHQLWTVLQGIEGKWPPIFVGKIYISNLYMMFEEFINVSSCQPTVMHSNPVINILRTHGFDSGFLASAQQENGLHHGPGRLGCNDLSTWVSWTDGLKHSGNMKRLFVAIWCISMDEGLTKRWYWVFPKIGFFPPKSSILIGFSIINHPFWGFYPYFLKHQQGNRCPDFLCFRSHRVLLVLWSDMHPPTGLHHRHKGIPQKGHQQERETDRTGGT